MSAAQPPSSVVLYHRVTPETAAILAGADPLGRSLLVQLVPIAFDKKRRQPGPWEPAPSFVSLKLRATVTNEQAKAWAGGHRGCPLLEESMVPAAALAGLELTCLTITVHSGALGVGPVGPGREAGRRAAQDDDAAWEAVAETIAPLVVALQARGRFKQDAVLLVIQDRASKEPIGFAEFRRLARRFSLPRAKVRTVALREDVTSADVSWPDGAAIAQVRAGALPPAPARDAKADGSPTRVFTFTLEIDAWLDAGGFPQGVATGPFPHDREKPEAKEADASHLLAARKGAIEFAEVEQVPDDLLWEHEVREISGVTAEDMRVAEIGGTLVAKAVVRGHYFFDPASVDAYRATTAAKEAADAAKTARVARLRPHPLAEVRARPRLGVTRADSPCGTRRKNAFGARLANAFRLSVARQALEAIWLHQGLLTAGAGEKACSMCGRRCWPRRTSRGRPSSSPRCPLCQHIHENEESAYHMREARTHGPKYKQQQRAWD